MIIPNILLISWFNLSVQSLKVILCHVCPLSRTFSLMSTAMQKYQNDICGIPRPEMNCLALNVNKYSKKKRKNILILIFRPCLGILYTQLCFRSLNSSLFLYFATNQHSLARTNWAPSSEIVSSSIPSWQISTAHAQPFRRFLLTHCLYEWAAKVLARLRGCAGSPEPSLLA